MKNLDETIKKTLFNMNYDSKKTFFENRGLLMEVTEPLTFIAPNPKSPTTNIKIKTTGKSLGTVSSNSEKLKESKPFHDETTLVYFPSRKYIYYKDGDRVSNYRNSSLDECVLERYPNGKIKKQDRQCLIRRSNRINELEKERHFFCLSKITNNQTLMNMPFAIQVSGTKMDQYGESDDGTYKIMFFLNGENCAYGGFNYYLDSGYETSLNTDYPLKPMKLESLSNQQQKPTVKKVVQKVKKVVQKVDTPKLTPEEQKKWCKEHGKQWDEEMGVCLGDEITVTPNDNKLTPIEKETKKLNDKKNSEGDTPNLPAKFNTYTVVIDDF